MGLSTNKPPIALLPSTSDLQRLSSQKIELILEAIDREGERKLRYARLGMICGTVCLLGSLTASSYLAVIGHEKMAFVILGTSVLSVIGKMILQRLG
jgi:hypothetical protein